MRKGDFSKKKGTLKIDYERAFTTPTGVSAVLKCTLTQNHKKGLISVASTITHQQISSNSEENKATIKALADLQMQAIEDGNKWKAEWAKENSDEDPDQLDIFGKNGNQEEE